MRIDKVMIIKFLNLYLYRECVSLNAGLFYTSEFRKINRVGNICARKKNGN